jgi:hypothetical protein
VNRTKNIVIFSVAIFIFVLLIIMPIGIAVLFDTNKSDRISRHNIEGHSELDHRVNQAKVKDYPEQTIVTSSNPTMSYPRGLPIPQLPGSLVTKIDSGENELVLETHDSDLNKIASFYRDWFENNGWGVRKDLIPAGFIPRAQLEYEKDGQIFSVEIRSEAGKDMVELRVHK